jgi:diguanylate cyclase (GGDEF)-like protein/PAS domain S-box-containing protein
MNKMNYNITLKFISITLLSLIVLMTAVQLISMLKIRSDISNIERLWDEVQVEQSEKLRLESSIRSFLGFGGMIHKLKDAILNDSITELEGIKSDLQSVETIIQLYSSFQLSEAERYALKDISEVVAQYQVNSDKFMSLFKQNVPQHKLDQFMRINDEPALRGLSVLAQQNHNGNADNSSDAVKMPDKFVLLTGLIAQFGYGGLIHHIKNYQLRSDNYYANASQKALNQLRVTLKKYQQQILTTEETNALLALTDSIEFYQQRLKNLQLPNKKRVQTINLQLKKIEEKTVNALQILNQHIEIELRSKTIKVGEKIYFIQATIDNLVKVILLISTLSLFFFAYIMFHKVILPLQKITTSMVLLARYGHKRELSFTANQIFEIRQIVRSIRIFKKNERKRRNIAKSLTKMNETTLKQLAEITALQDKSEQKTEQALSLANHLIELQKRADIDRNNALDNQSRVNMILNTVHDAIITTDKNGIIESINTATELMFGYLKTELIGQNINLLLANESADENIKIIDLLVSQGTVKAVKSNLEQTLQRANGELFPVEIFLGESKFNNETTYTAVIRDITQRRKDEQEIQKLILTDPLTNLANRRHFNQELQRSIESAQRLKLSVGLLMIDLDNFKPVNDTFGHNIGDKVLEKVSRRLEKIVRSVDLVARLGGDEFAIILNSVENHFDTATPAQKVIDSISKTMHIEGITIKICATIGIAIYPKDALALEDFIHHADKALYKAKSLGKGRYFLFNEFNDKES